MAQLQAEVKRGLLRSLYRQAKTASTPPPGGVPGSSPPPLTLIGVLDAFQDQGFAAVQRGRIIIRSSGAGKAVEVGLPDSVQSFTQENVFALSEEFEQIYADALTALGTASDDDIFAWMMADHRLATITGVQKDYTLLRWPGRY